MLCLKSKEEMLQPRWKLYEETVACQQGSILLVGILHWEHLKTACWVDSDIAEMKNFEAVELMLESLT